ncbi:MAG TPA: ATP-binding cassette domain-containing protein [Polyangiales bacterium]|nr:ATP-binding cassette domain-containing protein [Polyangiales bacterium]
MRGTLAHLREYVAPYPGMNAAIVGLLMFEAAYTAALPLGLMALVDHAIAQRDQRLVIYVLATLLAASLLSGVASVTRDYLYARAGAFVLRDLRLRMFDQLQRLSPEFYARTQSGDVLARFSNDLSAVETAVTSVVPWALNGVVGMFTSLVVLAFLDLRLCLLALLAVPLSMVGPRWLGPRAARAGYAVKQEEAAVTSAVAEHLYTHPVVRSFGLQQRRREAFRTRLEQLVTESRRFGFLSGLVQRAPNLAVALWHVLLLGVATWLAFQGMLSVGALLSFNLIYLNFAASVASLTEVSPTLLRASAGMERIAEVLRESPSVVDRAEPSALPVLREAIALRDVSFGYREPQLALRAVSLEIRRGWSVAIVGRSGSGKSSVLQLLTRFYDPQQGAVTWDGTDLRHVAQAELRSRLAVVFQDSLLFDGTIRENLRAGRLDASDAELEQAARAASLHDYVSTLPAGYDTPVGERGAQLSGGQRQRVAIARALVRNPELLVLDEATSALDGNTESAIEQTLREVSRGRTVVSVTHRLSSVQHADRIFVLDAGTLVEQGTHEQLLRAAGPYAELWRKQQGFRIAADGNDVAVEPERLSLIPMLGALDTSTLERVAHRLVVEHVPAGRLVLQEGDPGDHFYLIVRGRVAVSKRDATGREHEVGVLETGDHFGEIALLHDVARTATVRTLTPSLFLTLQRAQFLQLIALTPGLRETLEQRMRTQASEESWRPMSGHPPVA